MNILSLTFQNMFYNPVQKLLSEYKHTSTFNQMAQFQYENTKPKLKANTLIYF